MLSKAQTAAAENRLAGELSPYLLQHKGNPVDWYPWGEVAFAAARADNKPILLSVGYAACHWCHVMAHESFEDPAIAARMNELFVNIKVDREERPDLDTIYQSALALLGQQGGWPLTMFLTPKGEPFWGGTYFPPEPRYGRPGLPQVLDSVAEVYAQDPKRVNSNVVALKEALAKLSSNKSGRRLTLAEVEASAERLVREIDPFDGGFGTAPKFPQSPALKLLWRAWKRGGKEPYRQAVLLTLTRICQGGIYDHLGGGFARYTVDRHWLVPHFEKMLYDNAQLLDLLAWAWQETGDPLYQERASETVAWLEREMLADGGGFAASLDADSEGEEGRFYVWDEAEIDQALGAEAALFKQHYDVTASGNFEGRNILNRLQKPERASPEVEAKLARARASLLDRRAARVRPG
ncbi:MAG: thioredoxin domain-containing protein, partial [Kiloniellales bacterium]